jgi:hypothetical protein
MRWISGIGRDGKGRLCVKVQGRDSKETLTNLASLNADLGLPGGVRRKLALPLHQFRRSHAGHFLRALGFEGLQDVGQPVYEFAHHAANVLIPAQLLILAIFGPCRPMREVLLRPWGPRSLMTAFSDDEGIKVAHTPSRMSTRRANGVALLSCLSWTLTHSSAEAAWGSVFRNALDGRFDLQLPLAYAGMSIVGRSINGNLLVTRLTVTTIDPAEPPSAFVTSNDKQKFIFDEKVNGRPTHRKAANPSTESQLASLPSMDTLTDEQWERVERILLEFLRPKPSCRYVPERIYSTRSLVETIVLKLGKPYAWRKVPRDKKLVHAAQIFFVKLKNGGVWQKIVGQIY